MPWANGLVLGPTGRRTRSAGRAHRTAGRAGQTTSTATMTVEATRQELHCWRDPVAIQRVSAVAPDGGGRSSGALGGEAPSFRVPPRPARLFGSLDRPSNGPP